SVAGGEPRDVAAAIGLLAVVLGLGRRSRRTAERVPGSRRGPDASRGRRISHRYPGRTFYSCRSGYLASCAAASVLRPTGGRTMSMLSADYAKVVENSERVSWKLGDVFPKDAKLDFGKNFMPAAMFP